MIIEDTYTCIGCGEDEFISDEITLYTLPIYDGFLAPLCLNCGPEENYDNLRRDNEHL